MSKAKPKDSSSLDASGCESAPLQNGMSPYATGGGGVTFERKVAVQYLTHLLVGDSATELGDGRHVVSVAFQQAPAHSVDDLVVSTARSDELQPSLVLALGVRRSPNLIHSDVSSQKLIQQFVRAVIDAPKDGSEYRFGLVVSGPQQHANQLAQLTNLAADQMNASGFFKLVQTPGKFQDAVRSRLNHIKKLVKHALHKLGELEADKEQVEERSWQFLSRLTVLMPRLESTDETDWAGIVNSLTGVARDSDHTAASLLRDRLVTLTSEYSPNAAQVDLTLLRRDSHALLDPKTRRHQHGWQTLNSIHQSACESVFDEITTSDGSRCVRLDRSTEAMKLFEKATGAEVVVVSGESGVGKSALAVLGLYAESDAYSIGLQVLCINLRQIPELAIELDTTLGHPLSTLLCELSAPQRMLIIDGADAVTEGWLDAFRFLIGAAQASGTKVIAVTSNGSKQVVLDALSERFLTGVEEHVVPTLADSEIDEVVTTFPELQPLNVNLRSRELLRRLIVVDLLVRGQVSGTPLTDADAMNVVWFGLVRRRGMTDRGSPDAREIALLRLAEFELGEGERLDVINGVDPTALDGLRHDGLLLTSTEAPFQIGPEFGHDEVRRYAVARLLLASGSPASRLLSVSAPRWALSAARLACQAWLALPENSTTPLRGRFATLQASFDALVDAGHGARWGDVPSEALLKLADPEALLRDAWPNLLADNGVGLLRLARLVKQRLRDQNGIIDHVAVEPIITLLLDDDKPWRSGSYVQDLLRGWLHGHVVADTAAGQRFRVLLRERLVEACAEADRHLTEKRDAEATAHAARTPQKVEQERQFMEKNRSFFSEIGYGGQSPRQRPEVPREIRDEIVLELIALLGPDLGAEGEAILRRVAQDAPACLAPSVEELFTSRALASYRGGLLAHLTEAYYLDDEAVVDGFGIHEDGVRNHHSRSLGLTPMAAWYRGPFTELFKSDFRNGVGMLNRLLNHAAHFRARTLTSLDQRDRLHKTDTVDPYKIELKITGTRQLYVGDEHVWRWYRGTAVGPYPCFSALQALERVCDQLIKVDVPIRDLVAILLVDCENLAMVGLIVGLLVRHLENARDLLDPYLTEPVIWGQEFTRVVNEASPLAPDSKELVAPERRSWSLRDAALFLVVHADSERAVYLRALGETLVTNARSILESTRDLETTLEDSSPIELIDQKLAPVRAWASSLDRDTYAVHEAPDGIYIQATPSEDVVQALAESNKNLELASQATRLVVRYHNGPNKELAEAIKPEELAADMNTARKLLDNPPSPCPYDPWDTTALVAAVVLEAHLLEATDLPDDTLSFATETVLRIGEGAAGPRQYEYEDTFFEQGADRSAARAFPLLLLPDAAQLLAMVDGEDQSSPIDRAFRAGVYFARAVAAEVRLHLARGLDQVWKTPCVEHGRCHHDLGLQIAIEMMLYCILSARDPDNGQRSVLALKEPVTDSLSGATADSILVSRLDGALRTLAPAVMADICVSAQARELLLALLSAQRRSLLIDERGDLDHRGSHTLVSSRALLTLAKNGDDKAIYEHIDAYADNSTLLEKFLCALSAAAEETPDLAATAKQIWPNLVRHVLELNRTGHTPFMGTHYGNMALAALIPNATGEIPYLYREVNNSPIMWWNSLDLRDEVEAWLIPASGSATCVDQTDQLRPLV